MPYYSVASPAANTDPLKEQTNDMDFLKEPWLEVPDFAEERLHLVVSRLYYGRETSLAKGCYRPELGDDAWTVGSMSYRRSVHQLSIDERSGRWPWLRTYDEDGAFVLVIGAQPVRFGKDQGNCRPKRKLLRANAIENKISQRHLNLGDVRRIDEDKVVWRFLWEQSDNLEYAAVRLVKLHEGVVDEPLAAWQAPTIEKLRHLMPRLDDKPRNLPLPATGVDEKEETGDGS